ncbi:MAG TPA: hypothetical protein VGH28_13185 [Polyangiaceae bacterium]
MKYRLLAFATLAFACSMDTIPDGLRATPTGPGATVIFDALARPLPNIPLPNDVATFADPTSRTGRRINASLFAPTYMERTARGAFDDVEGWGTFAPITVAFQKPPGADPHLPAIDLDNVIAHMKGDGYRFEDDPIYLVNLTTGIPMFLDMGNGNFPLGLRDPNRYWPNDPHVATDNLLYEANEEGAGLLQGDYTPALDQDFDGVLDHPNTWGALKPGQIHGVDDLLTWYERETDTLVLQPLLPLDEKTEYAVVLTDRLKGSDGNPVKSPFPFVHHPEQVDSIGRLRNVLSKASLSNYYGDIAGTGLDHVAFAWTFTTQPVVEDMLLLRNGLYGKGPFAYFADQFPPKVSVLPAAGKNSGDPSQQPAGWKTDPTCAPHAANPYIVDPNLPDVYKALNDLYSSAFGYDKGDVKALNEENTHIDHVVIGTYQSPFLEGDPKGNDPDARFHVNFQTGQGDVRSDTVSFMLVVPKQTAQYKEPFPVTIWGHGVGGNFTEALEYGGNFARNGVATLAINMPQHGLPYDNSFRIPATADLLPDCLAPWVDAVLTSRALDRNGDGVADPGWWWWTSHIANVRDNVRQGTLDEMQLTRILRTFDGKTMSGQDFNDDGKEDLAGDFDADGVPDIAGPNNSIWASGESLGGIMSEIQGGIDHQLAGTAPMSGGGGLTHIGYRSYGVTESFGQLFGPLLIGIPASQRPPKKLSDGSMQPQTNCDPSQISVRIFAEDGDDIPETEISCLDPTEAGPNKTVVLTNLSQQLGQRAHCARTGADGSFRIEFGATYLDDLDVQFWNEPDAVDSYATCNVKDGATPGRHISTFEEAAAPPHATDNTCPTGSCAQFMDRFFPVGSQLVAIQDGLGFKRNGVDARRFWFLAQIGVDPADPINFAPYYMMRTLPDPDGNPVKPRALLSTATVGDGFVNIETGIAFGRAAGALPFLPPDALTRYPEYADYVTPQTLYDTFGHETPNDVLIDNYEVEGVARFGRRPAGPACGVNYDPSDAVTCPSPPSVDPTTCKNTLFDADWVSEGLNRYDAQHPAQPLRLARIAGLHIDPKNPQSLLDAWAPRIKGVPFNPDDQAWDASAPVLGMINVYIKPGGQHTWDVVDACKIWDDSEYGGNLHAHFFRSGGTDPYYLSHPSSHECLENLTCPFFAP